MICENARWQTEMRPNIRSTAFVVLVGLVSGATTHVPAQMLSKDMDIRHVTPPTTSVCQNASVNPQVREALRLVCTPRGSDEALTSAQRLIVIGFLGGFAKNGDSKHPEVRFGDYLREHYAPAIEVSVISNHEWRKAVRDVMRLLDDDHDGFLTAAEKGQAHSIRLRCTDVDRQMVRGLCPRRIPAAAGSSLAPIENLSAVSEGRPSGLHYQ